MAEQTKEAIGFLDKLEDLFLYDDQSRWSAIGWTIAIAGSLGTVDLVFLGASVDGTLFLMGAIILLMSVIWIGWYCAFRQQQPIEIPFMSRRAWVLQGAIFIAFLASLRFPRAEARTIERRLQEVSENPSSPQNIQDAKRLITAARAGGIKIAPSLVGNVGKKLLDVAEHHPTESNAWDAAQASIDYRSLFNVAPSFNIQNSEPLLTRYTYLYREGGAQPTLYFSRARAPREQAAVLELLGHPTNAGNPNGNAYLVVAGGDVMLDSLNMKNVVFQDSHVYYDGHPVVMEKVYFVNCTFEIVREPNGKLFANKLLENSGSAMTFHIG